MATIRKIAASDRDGLIAVFRSDETFRPQEIEVAMELVDDAIANGDQDYWARVVDVDGAIGGYICFGPTPMTAGTYDLYWIVVHSDFRGRGLAGKLIQHMEAELVPRGATAVRVETSQLDGYEAARKLYDRCGYPEVSRLPDFYRVGDDLIVYYKKL